MKNLLKNRLALSTVVTTLIILVVSVLLAGVVTYFAINVTSTRVQEESVTIQRIHVWVDGDGSQAAFVLINTGGRDIVINKITCRGQTADWAKVHYNVETGAVSEDLKYKTDASSYGETPDNAIIFESGKTMTVYIESPDSITINDIGLTVGITVFTSQAMYYQEANVQAHVAAASTA